MKMKKSLQIINIALIAVLAFSMFTGCSKNNKKLAKYPEVSEIEEAILKEIDVAETVKLDDKKLGRIYGIEAEELEGYFVYVSTSNVKADEVAVFKLKESTKENGVKSRIEERLIQLSKSFEDYIPAESTKIKNKIIEVKGNYILVVVSKSSDKIVTAFEKCFE